MVTGPEAAEEAPPAGDGRKRNVGDDGNSLPLTVTLNALRGFPCYDAAHGGRGVGDGQGGAGAESVK